MDEQDDERRMVLADPDSLLGMLQRGRGKGCLMALERPPQEVWSLLFECVTNHPRSNELFAPDEDYYASLILRTGMDLEPLLSFVRQNDELGDTDDVDVDLALSTLRSLARRGSRRALEFLREYLQHGSAFWRITRIVEDLAQMEALEGVDEILCQRVSSDPDLHEQLQDEIEDDWARYCEADEETRSMLRLVLPMCEPWKSLCERNTELAQFLLRNGLPYDPPPPVHRVTDVDVAGFSVAELLSSVDEASFHPNRRVLVGKVSVDDEDRLLQSLSSDDEYEVMLALCGLGELGTPRTFEAMRAYIEASEDAPRRVRGRAFDAIQQMPGWLTLETARQWFLRDEWHLYRPGAGILEHHATSDDIPLLIQALRTPEIVRDEDYRLAAVLGALTRFRGLGRIPELEKVFCQTENSIRRGDAAEAMAATSSEHFAAEYAYECLWDCDWSAFKAGCTMVGLSTPGAIERLREIVADPHESDDRREIASKRLKAAG